MLVGNAKDYWDVIYNLFQVWTKNAFNFCDVGGWKDYHFFLDSSIDTPPGPRDTTIKSPPMTESVWKEIKSEQ